MKALIIENEYQVDKKVVEFLSVNPNLFTETKKLICCLSRTSEEMLPYLIAYDAYITASTFMYKDQLTEMLTAFVSPKFPTKTIFINDVVHTINNWKHDEDIDQREVDLFELVKQLLTKGTKVYTYFEVFRSDKPNYSEVLYDQTNDVFYSDNQNADDLDMVVSIFKNKS